MSIKEKIVKFGEKPNMLLASNKTTFKDLYESFINVTPDVTAMIYHRSNDTTREYTYKEYARLVSSTSNKLSVALKKLKKNDIVALKLKNTPTWCIIFWGLLMAGFRPLLIDAKLASENTENLLKNAGAKAIINDEDNYTGYLSLTRNDIHAANEDFDFTPNWADEVMFCSSGTTGNIKIMIFNGFNMMNQMNESHNMPMETNDIFYPQSMAPLRVIALLPFHHIFAFVAVFLWYTFYNATLVFTSFIDPISITNDIRKYQVTHISHVPLFYDVVAKNFLGKIDDKNKDKINKLLNYNLGKINRLKAGLFIKLVEKKVKENIFGNQVRFCISGGGYLNDKTAETINGIGYPLYNGYGMTELGVTSVELSTNVNERLKRSIGHPFYGVEYKLSKIGELLVKSNSIHVREIIDGHLKDVSLDKDGYFATGDIAKEILNKYYIMGRIKDTIITSNGENVYPDEIESYFKKVKGIRNLTVFGSKNRIVLIIEGDSSLLPSVNEINKNLPIHKQVNDIVFIDEPLPLSSSMKVKRYEVKKKFENKEYELSENKNNKDILKGYDPQIKNKVVERLQRVFKQVLFISKDVKGSAHWINDLHSDSMTYITLIGEIEKEFSYKFPIVQYGKLTCLDEFAKEILDSICK